MKYFKFLIVVLCLMLIARPAINQKGFAMNIINNKYIICIDNFDKATSEYKQKFWDLDIALSFKVSNKNNYKNYQPRFDKSLIEYLIVPKTIMSIVATGNGTNLRQSLYDASNIAKKQGIVVVIFDVVTTNEEDIYYAISDSLNVLNNYSLSFVTYDAIY